MKKLLMAAAVIAAVSYATVDAAKPRAAVKAAAVGGAEIQMTGEVVTVSKLTNSVILKTPDGEKMKLKIPREVRDLDQIKPGALLTVRYTRAAAVAIGRTGAVPAVEDETVVAERGSAPGQEIVHNRFVVGRIEDVDMEKRELKVKAPDDETITLHVAPGVSGFEDAKIGDTVAIRFNEAVALVVTPKAGKPGAPRD